MGATYKASCSSCGYEVPTLLDGSGFSAVPYSPAICHTCNEVFSLRLDRARLRCPRCRRKPALINTDESSQPLSCPKCGNASLQLDAEGLWD
jgi:predicted RNA-binding Zn-ribbon protein involved in translation (DUF1610 family)